MPKVSVLISVYQSEKYVEECLKSLLNQTYKDYEIIIIEDPPYDNTKNIINIINNKKILYIRNENKLGLSKTRNKCVANSSGKYLFFTDDDCTVKNDWLEEGIKTFENNDCLGVEGLPHYVSPDYKTTISDKVYIGRSKKGGNYMTMNIAYKSELFTKIDGFDERLDAFEDRDLALRALKIGKIPFNPKMIVYHQKITLTPKEFIKTAKRIKDRVVMFKKHKEKPRSLWRIIRPKNLLTIFFPPLILTSFFTYRYKTREDFILLPCLYVRAVYERIILWKTSFKERVFFI